MPKSARKQQKATEKPEVEVFHQITHHDEWRVEAINLTGDGDVNVCRFEGPLAEELARHVAGLFRKETARDPSSEGGKVVSITKRRRK